MLARVHPNIVAHTEKNWDFIIEEKDLYFIEDHFCSIPNYNFMAYCRRYGFPSLLLGLTKSLYIALFFAYQETEGRYITICLFMDSIGAKVGEFYASQIIQLGPYVNPHKKHFIQQAQYTVSVKREKDLHWSYCPMEDTLSQSYSGDQDIIYKFILSAGLRDDVLKNLAEKISMHLRYAEMRIH